MTTCKDCETKNKCPFYENDEDECVYDVLAEMKKNNPKMYD